MARVAWGLHEGEGVAAKGARALCAARLKGERERIHNLGAFPAFPPHRPPSPPHLERVVRLDALQAEAVDLCLPAGAVPADVEHHLNGLARGRGARVLLDLLPLDSLDFGRSSELVHLLLLGAWPLGRAPTLRAHV